MRLIKMLGLAAVAAIAAMAVVGASSAMAGNTQLCSEDPGGANPCPGTSALTSIHSIDPLAVLKTTFPSREILCQALFSGTVLGLGAPQIIHGEFEFSLPHSSTGECFEMKTEEHCFVNDINGGLIDVLRTATELAKVTGLNFDVLVECTGLHCVYEAAGLEGHGLGPLLAGGGLGNITITNQEVEKKSGLFCPSTSLLTTTQEPLTDVYIGV